MKTTDRAIGLQMAALVAASGRHEAWVSTKVGLSQSYLSLLLHGKRRWTQALWARIVSVLDEGTALDMDSTDEQFGTTVRLLAKQASGRGPS